MRIVFLVIALLVAVLIHEYAHYRAFKADGIRIVAAGLGLPFPPVLKVRLRGVTWTLSPWLAGAYVQPSAEDSERVEASAPYGRLAWWYGAGVTVNVCTGLAALSVATFGSWVRCAVFAGLAVACWAWRHQVASIIQPALALPALVLTVPGLIISLSHGEGGIGLAGLGAMAPDALTVQSMAETFGIISISFAIVNLLPVYPTDNARTVNLLIQRWWGDTVSRRFEQVGRVVVAVMLVGWVLSDGWAVFSAVA